ncbi:cyclic nucleotide-gated olfactory channel-like protein [Sarcoptes scabiei]|uniref:Cyclic nucleotide-gated olfactory channel-like protein n=1 Tax=Sarcoptes scabiei TaxID=52283 RepID=A0A132AEU4_SARSC|nr:cyclic nucleotide-gated olfactory channel-like protein [Sarcoptes scabiei]
MYWSVLALTTIGDLPTPRNKSEYLFLIMQLVFGLFLFATVLGHVANIVTNVSAARKEFQDCSLSITKAKLDAVKTYMRMRRVPDHIQTKVIRWFDYLWMTQKSSDEERSVGCLPDKLKAEIAIHVHLDTLKRVEIFQNTEAGFLCELVLRLRPVLFSPGDYICRKGEVGKEMYIVNRGRISSILYNQNLRLQVVTDNGKTVLATLRAGSYFGEISILNMGTAGNRRTASVRSVGYSDLFCLNKQDMWDVLKDYPAARVRLEAIAVKRLEKYRKEPLKKIAMGRSKSTPGLVESKGKIPMSVEIQLKENQSASTATLLKEEPDIEERIIGKNRFDQDGSDEVAIESASSVDTMKASSSRDGQQSSCDSNTKASGSHPYQSPLMNPSNNPAPQTLIYSHLLSPNVALVNFDSRSPQSSPLQHANLYSSSPMPTTFFQAQHFHPFGGSPVASNNQLPISSLSSNAGPIHSVSVNNSQSCAVNNNNSVSEESAFTNIQIEFPTQDSLLSEIKRLRGRLLTLETENVSMSMKLNQQQWQVENRLAEIEHQISSAATTNPIPMSFMSSNSSNASAEDNERNRESII